MPRKRAPPIGIHVKGEGEGDRYGIAAGDGGGGFMMDMMMVMMMMLWMMARQTQIKH